MTITCDACGKSHKSNDKLKEGLKKLAPGQQLRLKCSQCGESIVLGAEMLDDAAGSPEKPVKKGSSKKVRVKPPEPPDTSWLQDGIFEEEKVVSDIPQAIVLIPEGESRELVTKALTGLGYQAETVADTNEALEKMQFFNYSSIVMHSSFEGRGLAGNKFHEHMCSMNMSRRRYIFYAVLGPEFKTFYNLQALAHSVNLVVNEKDIKHFGVILRKTIPEYEELFGPIMEELRVQGK